MLGRLIIIFGLAVMLCSSSFSFAEDEAKDPAIALKIELLELKKQFKIEQIKNAMLISTIQTWNDPEFQKLHRELREAGKELEQLSESK